MLETFYDIKNNSPKTFHFNNNLCNIRLLRQKSAFLSSVCNLETIHVKHKKDYYSAIHKPRETKITMLPQSVNPGKTSDKEGSCGDLQIFLGM